MIRKRHHRFRNPGHLEYPRRRHRRRVVGVVAGFGAVALILGALPDHGRAFAQLTGDPVVPGDGRDVMTGPTPFRIAVGAVRAVELAAEAGSVTVADPEVADVVPAGGKRLIVMGRSTGQTGLLVHDRTGGQLLNATIVVTPERDRTVSVNRGVEEDRMVCAPDCVSTRPPSAAGGGDAADPMAQATKALQGLQDKLAPK